MPKYKVGDILKSKQSNHAPLVDGGVYRGETRWVPNIGESYSFLDDAGGKNIATWRGYLEDEFRLSIGNVFQVGDHEGIEALKRKLQEGGKSL